MPTDGEVADARAASSNHVCRDTSVGDGRASPGQAESVRPGGAARQLGKTCRLTVQDGEVRAEAAGAVVKHPLPISPSRVWFALDALCQPGRAGDLFS